jgi:hypothetical protein
MPFGPADLHSAPVERCTATVAPLAAALGATVQLEPLLAEDAYRDDPAAARRRLVELATAQTLSGDVAIGGPPGRGGVLLSGGSLALSLPGDVPADVPARTVVACSQGGVIPGVVKSLAGRSDVPVPRTGTAKGAFWYLSFDGRRLVQADSYPSPNV